MKPTHWLVIGVAVLALLLVAALAAAAQDATAGVEIGESASPVASLDESEPNNGYASADRIAIGDVVAGKIKGKADLDYYRLDLPQSRQVVIEIDAQSIGSPLDAKICLFDSRLYEQACNDSSDGTDPLLFRVLNSEGAWPGSPYYIRVQAHDYPNVGGDAFTYKLAVYQPLFVSAATGGEVAGVRFSKSDVLAHHDFADGTEKWLLFFDASDVGIETNVVGLAAAHNDDDISLVLQQPQEMWINWTLSTVTPYDILYFVPGEYGAYGPQTGGDFYIPYHGFNTGLTETSEKIDALAMSWWVSTTGEATFASGETVRDEDISNMPYGFLIFDGSLVRGLAAEDVIGADVGFNEAAGLTYYLTILGSGRVGNLNVNQKTIFTVDPETMQVSGRYWRGSDHHFPYNLDAIEIE